MSILSCLPSVHLDITLADLYSLESQNGALQPPLLINAFPSSDCDMTSCIPRNKKYLYQDSELVKTWTEEERRRIERIIQIKLLSILGQRYSFVCGNMLIVLFDPDFDEKSKDVLFPADHAEFEARQTFAIFPPEQIPQLKFVSGPSELLVDSFSGRMIPAMPFDGLDDSSFFLDPEVHYMLLSKGALATSDIPTPKSILISAELSCPVLDIADQRPGFYSNQVDGVNTQDIHALQCNVRDVLNDLKDTLENRELPFVLKLQQSTSGGGVYIIHSADQRRDLMIRLETTILPNLLSSINRANMHLNPATIILSDYVPAINSRGIDFFVSRAGLPYYIGYVEQIFSNEVIYTGGTTDYRLHHQIEATYRDVLQRVSAFLSKHKYYGPANIDVLEDKDRNLWVVDLNVRISGSYPLSVLRGFFSEQHGLHHACILTSIRFRFSREYFVTKFARDFREGRIVIVAWYEELEFGKCKTSWVNVAVAAETPEALSQIRGSIEACGNVTEDEVTQGN